MSEMLTGVVHGSLYPNRMQGATITVRIHDDYWGRCEEHLTWVRLEDIEPEPEPEPEPEDGSLLTRMANVSHTHAVSDSMDAMLLAYSLKQMDSRTVMPGGFDIGGTSVYTSPTVGNYAQAEIEESRP